MRRELTYMPEPNVDQQEISAIPVNSEPLQDTEMIRILKEKYGYFFYPKNNESLPEIDDEKLRHIAEKQYPMAEMALRQIGDYITQGRIVIDCCKTEEERENQKKELERLYGEKFSDIDDSNQLRVGAIFRVTGWMNSLSSYLRKNEENKESQELAHDIDLQRENIVSILGDGEGLKYKKMIFEQKVEVVDMIKNNIRFLFGRFSIPQAKTEALPKTA